MLKEISLNTNTMDINKFFYNKTVIRAFLKEVHRDKEKFFSLLNNLFREVESQDLYSYFETSLALLIELGYTFKYCSEKVSINTSKGLYGIFDARISIIAKGAYESVYFKEIENISFINEKTCAIKIQRMNDIGVVLCLENTDEGSNNGNED